MARQRNPGNQSHPRAGVIEFRWDAANSRVMRQATQRAFGQCTRPSLITARPAMTFGANVSRCTGMTVRHDSPARGDAGNSWAGPILQAGGERHSHAASLVLS